MNTHLTRRRSRVDMGRRAGLACVIAGGLVSLSSCAGLAPASSGLVAQAQSACVSVAPVVQAASVVADSRVQSIVGYANAFCGPLAAGSVPSTLDANSSPWLGSLAGMLKVLAPVALSLL